MDRRALETAAVRATYLRGLTAVPRGVLFLVTGAGNLGWEPLGNPFVFLAILWVLGAGYAAVTRYYDERYGRVRLTRRQQLRFAAASFACFAIGLVGGSLLDFHLDLPVSLFAVTFGVAMLVWFGICVGLRRHHVVVWGALVVAGLLPVWGGFDDRMSVGWFPIGVATIVAGTLDHRALAASFGPTDDDRVRVS